MGQVSIAQEEFRQAALEIPEIAELRLYTQDFGHLSTLELVEGANFDRNELDVLASLPLLLRLWRRSRAITALEKLVQASCGAAFEPQQRVVQHLPLYLNSEVRAVIQWLCMRRMRSAKMQDMHPMGSLSGSVARHWSHRMRKESMNLIEPDYDLAQENIPAEVVQNDVEAADALLEQCIQCTLVGHVESSPLERLLTHTGDIWIQGTIDALSTTQKHPSQLETIFEEVMHSLLETGLQGSENELIPVEGSCLVMENLNVTRPKIDLIKHLRALVKLDSIGEKERQFYGILSGDFAAATDAIKDTSDWETLLLITLTCIIRDAQTGLSQSRANHLKELSQLVLDQPLTKLPFPQIISQIMTVLRHAEDHSDNPHKHSALIDSLSALLTNMQNGVEFAYCEFVETILKNVSGLSHPLMACVALEGALLWRELESEARDEYLSRYQDKIEMSENDGADANPFEWVKSIRVCNVTNAALRRYIELCVEHRNLNSCDTWAPRAVRLISCVDAQLQRKLIAEVLCSELRINALEEITTPINVRNVIYEAAGECPKSALASWSLVKDGLIERVNEVCTELRILESKLAQGIRYESDVLVHDEIVLLQKETALFIRISVNLSLEHFIEEEENLLYNVPNAHCSGELFIRSLLIEMTTSALLALVTLNYFYFTRLTETVFESGFDPSSAIWGVSTRERNCVFWQGTKQVGSIPRHHHSAVNTTDLRELNQEIFDNLIAPMLMGIKSQDDAKTIMVVPHSRQLQLTTQLTAEKLKSAISKSFDGGPENSQEWRYAELECFDGILVDGVFASLIGLRNWAYAQCLIGLVNKTSVSFSTT